jgi:CHAD domain-containing protein
MARAQEVDLQAGDAFGVAAARVVAVRASELFDHADFVLDTEDITHVHAMRVATRRLRAALEIFERAFPAEEWEPLLAEVKALADALGARRDPDVQLEHFTRMRVQVTELERPAIDLVLAQLVAEQQAGNDVLAVALEQARADDLAGRLQALATTAEAAV